MRGEEKEEDGTNRLSKGGSFSAPLGGGCGLLGLCGGEVIPKIIFKLIFIFISLYLINKNALFKRCDAT